MRINKDIIYSYSLQFFFVYLAQTINSIKIVELEKVLWGITGNRDNTY